MIKSIKLKSDFSRNVLTLLTGTTIAQAIPIAISPILTRIYTPEDFGVLALYISVASIISAVSTMRYELAIIQPREEEDAMVLVTLSLLITCLISIVTLLFVFIFHSNLVHLLGSDAIGPWLYFIPISVFLTGSYQTFNYWNIRSKSFKTVSASKISQGVGTAAGQVSLGALVMHGGLLVGFIFGQLTALCYLVYRTVKRDSFFVKNFNIAKTKENAKLYKNFPIYSSPGALADSFSLQMPIFVLTKFFSESITGIFSLVFKVLNLPASLMSQAISQTLFQKISFMHYESPHQIQYVIIKLFFTLFVLVIPFATFIWFFGDDLFAFVFGEPWREAGSYASILIFAVAIRFAVSPLSIVLALEHNIKMGVLWQFIYLITITFTLLYFSSYDVQSFLLAFTVHEFILYSLYLVFILKGSKYLKESS